MNQLIVQPISAIDYQLQPTRIDVWQFSLDNLPEQAMKLLNNEEQERAKRFYFAKHQRRFSVARAMMRLILGRYLNQSAISLHFFYNKHGKPELHHSQKPEFNLSHSGDLALLAVGQDLAMGIDLEYFSARPWINIANNAFSLEEITQLKKQPNHLMPIEFFRTWAQKEAFIKATGLGLAYPTTEFSVPTLTANNRLIYDEHNKTSWQIHSFMPSIACCGALCYDPSVTCLRHITVHPEHFFRDYD